MKSQLRFMTRYLVSLETEERFFPPHNQLMEFQNLRSHFILRLNINGRGLWGNYVKHDCWIIQWANVIFLIGF